MTTLRGVVLALFATGCGGVHPMYDEATATQKLPVALVSLKPEENGELNRTRITEAVERVVADHPEVRLISFGELTTGFYWKGFDEKYQRTVAEPIDGQTITALRAFALQHHVFIALGFSEGDGEAIFNSAVVIDDAGDIVAHKRKSNFVPMDEAGGFTKGDRTVPTFMIDGVKAAVLICNDFNDTAQREAITNDPDVRLVVMPQSSAGLTPDTVERSPYPFNGAWMLAPQRLGWEGVDRFHGGWVVDPNGAVPARANGSDLIVTELRFVPSPNE